MTDNPVQIEWENTLAGELNNNLLLDSAKGKTAYACGIAYALLRLRYYTDKAEWEQLRDEAAEFCAAYMRECE